MIDEQGVELATGGMTLTHVQRLEVVPVGLHLGALGDTEPEPEEDVLEALPGLGDDVEVPTAAGVAVLGQIKSLVGDAGVDLGVAE